MHVLSALSIEVGLGAAASVDHYLDAVPTRTLPVTSRRNLYSENRRFLFGAAVTCSGAAFVTALLMLPWAVLVSGAYVAGALGVYFLYAHVARRPRFKELWVARGYSGGVWVPAIVEGWAHGGLFSNALLLLPAAFFLISAATNVYVHAVCDFDEDMASGQTSLATATDREVPRRVLALLGSAAQSARVVNRIGETQSNLQSTDASAMNRKVHKFIQAENLTASRRT